jgi:hypothetical protein
LNSSAQIFGIFFIYIQGKINTVYGAQAGNIFVSVTLLVGTVITGIELLLLLIIILIKKKLFSLQAFIKSDLKRQKTLKQLDLAAKY